MRRLYQIIICVALLCGAVSCQKDPSEGKETSTDFIAKTATSDFSATALKEQIAQSYPLVAEVIEGLPAKAIRTDAITYHSVDPQGKEITASGIIVYPTDVAIRGVIVAQHFTIMSNSEAPSKALFLPESLFGLLGYVVIATDYVGFGATSNLPHPYLHVESTGQVTADMVFAAREYMASLGKPIDQPMYVIGYSQGGAAAVAFQKMAETQYPNELPLIKVFAGGGPYDLTGTYDEFTKTDYTAYPCSVPYISIGLDYGDNLNLNFANLFKEPLLSNYALWYNSKQYNSTQVNDLIGSTKISDFMNNDMFTPQRNADIDKLYESLKKNSLVDWKPKTKLWLFHGKKDTYVPYLNATSAYGSFSAQGCDVELKTGNGDHLDQAIPFYLHIFNELKK